MHHPCFLIIYMLIVIGIQVSPTIATRGQKKDTNKLMTNLISKTGEIDTVIEIPNLETMGRKNHNSICIEYKEPDQELRNKFANEVPDIDKKFFKETEFRVAMCFNKMTAFPYYRIMRNYSTTANIKTIRHSQGVTVVTNDKHGSKKKKPSNRVEVTTLMYSHWEDQHGKLSKTMYNFVGDEFTKTTIVKGDEPLPFVRRNINYQPARHRTF